MRFTNKNTKTWNVAGIITSFQNGFPQFMNKKFVVRYTSDKVGKSLSIADEKSGVMFQIPFDAIYREIMGDNENEQK
jgi:hypothetical protein